ncbi:Apolipoprotein B-100 [Merluccius polli]|uniref:Apolipoprotein B-100 n=1 Tax=Merluccius polli TaxID=89951 RepID=A0AA47MCN8_MERPO|nr:Apolipoprotein B-100 [Merluccius polli]
MMTNRAVLTHTDLTVDVNHVITQALSISRQSLNVDITSPTFTEVNFRYAAGKDGISASWSTPSTGYLGLQFMTRHPSQMSARLYSRYASAPENDVDVLAIRTSPKGDDKMNLQVAYNMEVPTDMLFGLKERLPSITSAFIMFAEKYQITMYADKLINSVSTFVRETYDSAMNYDMKMSQLSIFFKNVIALYQKTVQVSLDAVVKVLRETKFKLPGSEEITTLPEILKTLTSSIAAMIERAIQIINKEGEVYLNSLAETMSDIKFQYDGGAITIPQMVQMNVKSVLDFVKNMESLDVMLEKIRETTQAVIIKSQEFIDSIQSDYLDAVLFNMNFLYRKLVTVISEIFDRMAVINMDSFNITIEYLMEMMINVMSQFQKSVTVFVQQASEETKAYIKVSNGRLELDLPVPFKQLNWIIVKYNRRKNVLATDIQIGKYDVDAGIRLGVADGNTKSNLCHEVQLLIPSITANMKHGKEMECELKIRPKQSTTSTTTTSFILFQCLSKAEVSAMLRSNIYDL